MGLHRGFTRAAGITLIIIISITSISTVNADNLNLPDADKITSQETNEGLAWIGLTCEKTNQDCLELNITIVWPNGSVEEISSSQTQDILRNITAGTIAIYAEGGQSCGHCTATNWGLGQEGWRMELFLPGIESNEITDHPEHFSSQEVLSLEEYDFNAYRTRSTGSLNGSDTDVLHIPGNEGDILHFYYIDSRYPLTWDILDTSGQAPILIETLDESDNPGYGDWNAGGNSLIEIPSNEGVYLKIHSNDGEDENLYYFSFNVWSDLEEQSMNNPDSERTQRLDGVAYPDNGITATIGPMDNEGDFWDLKVGPGSPIEIHFTTSDLIELRYIENGEMVELQQSSGTVRIENVGEINTTLPIHIRSENVVRYSFWHHIDADSDGETLGDAPDTIVPFPAGTEPPSAYPGVATYSCSVGEIRGISLECNGFLSHSEDIDYWFFEVTELNGSIAHLIPATDSDDCCLMEIIPLPHNIDLDNQTGYETYQLEKGLHAIRISNDPNRTSFTIPTSYSFRVELQEIDEPIYVDRSGEFTTFYIVVGLVLLSPLLPIAYWQWKDRDIIRVEKHERLRLVRLRERLSGIGLDSQADEDIDAALSSLGDAEWDALIQEWGKPDVRHSTEDLDLAAWRLEMDSHLWPTLLIGIRPKVDWEHAGIRLSATMGERISIEGVHPSHLHFEDEIVLDKLKSQNLHFIRVQHAHSSSKLDVVVTGTVEGVPMAAMPSKALNHSEE